MQTRWTLPAAFLSAAICYHQGALADEPSLMRGGTFSTIASGEAKAAAVSMTLDHAKILKLDEPAQTIVIGNPGIVDGTISDQKTLVLTGKAVGTTNLIVIGDGARQISSLTISVGSNDLGRVSVYNGAQQQTYSCVGSCIPMAALTAAAPPKQDQ